MIRIVSALFLVIIVLVGLPLITLAQGKDSASSAGVVPPLTVEINGLKVNAPAEMDVAEGQVMVPLRWAAEQLGASSVEWDSETRTVTIRTRQDFYNLEKLNSYVRALQDSSNEQNDQLWPLPARVRNLPLSHAVPNPEQVLELDKYRGHSPEPTLPHDPIYIGIISEDGSYEHGSFVYSAENRQDHYYLPMDWLEYLFHASADYNEVANVLSIQPPDVNQVKSQIAWAENALVPVSAEEALRLWGRGLQTRNGALQYAALSPQLRHKADNSYNVLQTYWVTGFSSPWAGPLTITSQDKISDTRVEYTISFPEITSAAPNTTATEKLVIEKISYESGEGWFITQILQSSGYGIIGADIDANVSKELENVKDNFYETISYDPGQDLLSFTIPQTIPSGYKFYHHVSGRMFMGDNSDGMSFHAFDKESQDFSWEKGRTYTYSLPSATLDECIIDFGLIDCNNQEFITTVQISADGNKTIIFSQSGTTDDIDWQALAADYNPPAIGGLLAAIKDSRVADGADVEISDEIKQQFNKMGEDYLFFYMPEVTWYDFESTGAAISYMLFTWTAEFGTFPEEVLPTQAEARLRKIFAAPDDKYPQLTHQTYPKSVRFNGTAYSPWPESYNADTMVYDLVELKERKDGTYTYYTATANEYGFDVNGYYQPGTNEMFLAEQSKALGLDYNSTLNKLLTNGQITQAEKGGTYVIEFRIAKNGVVPTIVCVDKF